LIANVGQCGAHKGFETQTWDQRHDHIADEKRNRRDATWLNHSEPEKANGQDNQVTNQKAKHPTAETNDRIVAFQGSPHIKGADKKGPQKPTGRTYQFVPSSCTFGKDW
jgi:hypothetical protein